MLNLSKKWYKRPDLIIPNDFETMNMLIVQIFLKKTFIHLLLISFSEKALNGWKQLSIINYFSFTILIRTFYITVTAHQFFQTSHNSFTSTFCKCIFNGALSYKKIFFILWSSKNFSVKLWCFRLRTECKLWLLFH